MAEGVQRWSWHSRGAPGLDDLDVRAARDEQRSEVVHQVVVPETEVGGRPGTLPRATRIARPSTHGASCVSHSFVSSVSARHRATWADSSTASDDGIGTGVCEVSDFSGSAGCWTAGETIPRMKSESATGGRPPRSRAGRRRRPARPPRAGARASRRGAPRPALWSPRRPAGCPTAATYAASTATGQRCRDRIGEELRESRV